MDEKAIIANSRAGDREAFGKLYDRYVRRIYAYIFFKTRHRETAEDLTSETFVKALQHIGRLDPTKPFAPWLYTIARNTIRDYYRAKGNAPHADIEDVWDLASDDDAGANAEEALRTRTIAAYLRDLSAHERDIIMLRVWQELSYGEIAAVLGVSAGASKMTYSRAVGKLRKVVPEGLAVLALLELFIS